MPEYNDKDYGIAPIKMPLDKTICIDKGDEDEGVQVKPTPSQYDPKECRFCALSNLCASVKKAYRVTMSTKNAMRKIADENDLDYDDEWLP